MDNLVSILLGSLHFFLGLLALLVIGMTIGNFATLYWLRRDLEVLEQEVFERSLEPSRRHKPRKKRGYRRRKQTAKPSTRRVKEKRAKGVREYVLIDD